mmetsp:Transcript_20039/g.56644  ORF Transcript_20039/g.56644 Transcript_20039/m.56644 type:complete len:176 (-) Transcript_20039:168-695(-)
MHMSMPRLDGALAHRGAPGGQWDPHSHADAVQPHRAQPYDDSLRALIRGEVQQALGSSLPPQPAAKAPSAPVQVIIRNTTTSTSEQVTEAAPPPQQPPPPPESSWDTVRRVCKEIWASPSNRIFLLSTLGVALYIYQGREEHRWRMAEMQRRIDRNPLLRFAMQVLPPTAKGRDR